MPMNPGDCLLPYAFHCMHTITVVADPICFILHTIMVKVDDPTYIYRYHLLGLVCAVVFYDLTSPYLPIRVEPVLVRDQIGRASCRERV